MLDFKKYAELRKNHYSNLGELAQLITEDENFPKENCLKSVREYAEENYPTEQNKAAVPLWKSYIKYRSKLRKESESTMKSFEIPDQVKKKVIEFKEKNKIKHEIDAVVILIEKGLNK